jgi:hypothetical protein
MTHEEPIDEKGGNLSWRHGEITYFDPNIGYIYPLPLSHICVDGIYLVRE